MRTHLRSAAALLLLLCAAPLQAQSYQRLTNAQNGVGCASSRGGSPYIFSFDQPRINASFTIEAAGFPDLPLFTPGLMAFIYGFSKAQWGSFALPYDLGQFGIPGCFAHVSVDAIFPMVYPFNTASLQFTIFIPNDPSLAGLMFYNQGLIMDPMAPNPARVTTSNCGMGQIQC